MPAEARNWRSDLNDLYLNRLQDRETGKEPCAYAMRHMLNEPGGVREFLSHHLIYIGIAHGIVDLIRHASVRARKSHGHIQPKLGPYRPFLRAYAMQPIEAHILESYCEIMCHFTAILSMRR